LLSLLPSEEEILGGMKPKWRYNVRLGEKKGVTVRYLENQEALGAGIDFFYDLYRETAERDGIAIHSRAYYERLFSLASEYSGGEKAYSARLYCAEHEGDALASIITLFYGTKAVYLYGASSNHKRNLMPAYALQWAAMGDAKKWGCVEYDFYGISPTDDPRHPMHGLYRFKTGFGGSIVHRVGSLDIPLKPLVYGAYRLAEALRTLWFKKIVKALRR
jgi:lipid II:glycine glycyltransferase (peptidoglycan interpeptide bridge formation enzyme)